MGPILHTHLPPPASSDAASRKTNKQTKRRSRFGAAAVCDDCLRRCFALARLLEPLSVSNKEGFWRRRHCCSGSKVLFYEAGRTKFGVGSCLCVAASRGCESTQSDSSTLWHVFLFFSLPQFHPAGSMHYCHHIDRDDSEL